MLQKIQGPIEQEKRSRSEIQKESGKWVRLGVLAFYFIVPFYGFRTLKMRKVVDFFPLYVTYPDFSCKIS